MEFCPTLDIIGDYFTGALHGYQLRRFRNIILGIHEDDIPSFNAFRRALIPGRRINYGRKKKRIRSMPNLQVTKETNESVGRVYLTY